MDGSAPRHLTNRKKTKMQVANVWLQLNELGSNVQLKRITPAEALIVRKLHGVKVEGQTKPTNPLSHIDILKEDVKRDNEAEYSRLAKKFGNKVVETAFPGENPKLPQTFAEAGFENTDEAAPKEGKAMEVASLATLPKGDKGNDLDPELASKDAEIAALKTQIAAKTDEKKPVDVKK